MKNTSKKIFGGLIVATLIATIGVVVVSASPGIFSDLTEEQIEELKQLREELRDENASREEIREAMEDQLKEFGIEIPTREEIIDNRINQTKKRLEILERIKELIQENPEITNEEIQDTIKEEFELEEFFDFDLNGPRGFHRGHFGFHRGFCEDQNNSETSSGEV